MAHSFPAIHMGLEVVLYSNHQAILTPMKITTNKLEKVFQTTRARAI
jgi:hypothetical protein